MKKILIICAGGMSSSLLAKKATEHFEAQEKEILVEATGTGEGTQAINEGKYDLYLLSPQTKMHYDRLAKAAEKHGNPVINIPPQAYVPIPSGTERLTQVIEDNLV